MNKGGTGSRIGWHPQTVVGNFLQTGKTSFDITQVDRPICWIFHNTSERLLLRCERVVTTRILLFYNTLYVYVWHRHFLTVDVRLYKRTNICLSIECSSWCILHKLSQHCLEYSRGSHQTVHQKILFWPLPNLVKRRWPEQSVQLCSGQHLELGRPLGQHPGGVQTWKMRTTRQYGVVDIHLYAGWMRRHYTLEASAYVRATDCRQISLWYGLGQPYGHVWNLCDWVCTWQHAVRSNIVVVVVVVAFSIALYAGF